MNVLIVGAKGFIGKNLFYKLRENKKFNILTLDKTSNENEIENKVCTAELIFLIFGVNKEKLPKYRFKDNYNFTNKICSILKRNNKNTSIVFTSSIQVNQNNPYGKSKLKAEKILLKYKKDTKAKIMIYRLPNIFGKWSKPHHNSVVATFCFNITRNKKINISNNNKVIKLLYIDDLIEDFIKRIKLKKWNKFIKILKTYDITLLKLANLIHSFNTRDKTYLTNDVSRGLVKKLYSTFVSFFPNNKFTYKITKHSDNRGSFVEFLKNEQIGQISFFSILPKKTRGNHFHHTKSEKFIVIKGKVRFNFTNIINKKEFSIFSDENKNLVINTIPGWAHNMINLSSETSIILVWSNEIFDKNKSDTFFYKL